MGRHNAAQKLFGSQLVVSAASHRTSGVNKPRVDIWDGGRETEKGTHLDRD